MGRKCRDERSSSSCAGCLSCLEQVQRRACGERRWLRPSCRWDTGTLLPSRAQSWQGSAPRGELLAHLGPGGHPPLMAPASRGMALGKVPGQERAPGHVCLPRAISSPLLPLPTLLGLCPSCWGCSCPGRLSLSQHWLQAERAPQERPSNGEASDSTGQQQKPQQSSLAKD